MTFRHGLVLIVLVLAACGDRGTLDLTIRDDSSGAPTPARVELLDEDGHAVIPPRALAVFEDCGRAPVHNWLPWAAQLQMLRGRHRGIRNPFTGTRQFYSEGSISVRLRPGRYAVKATKGIEYRTASSAFVVVTGKTEHVDLKLVRWIDLPKEGWYGADDHLHIPRPHPRFDPVIASWMQAEDIHVANLLQMGLARDVHITPQHGFGPRSVYRKNNTLVVSGQENPRTHVLGHSITLGARRWIDFPRGYLLYDRFWQSAHRHGGINGYAHWGLAGAEEGLAVWGHERLLDFIEVLNLGFPFYQRWYEALDLGIRLSPTAGTDYPCLPSLPGRERFYTRLDGPLEYEAWLEAVRRGKTFVTNGPVIDLTVDGVRVGEEVRLAAPRAVRVEGSVRFDPDRDDVRRLELIRGGAGVVLSEERPGSGEIRMQASVMIEQSTWLALRASGWKRDETEIEAADLLGSFLTLKRRTNDDLTADLPAGPVKRASAAHTAAIYVGVEGTPSIAEQPRARVVLQAWLARLDELQDRFREERIGELTGFPGRGDGIGEAELRASRSALLRSIEAARRHHEALAAP